MEKTPLEQALDYVFVNEGGFDNNPADSGGATRYGIIRSEASRWRKRPVSVQEMKEFPKSEAIEIYEAWYWKPLACDQIIDLGVAICMFDIGVVRGIGIPPKYAQNICNNHGANLVVDGHIGPKTLAALNALNPSVFIRDFSARSEAGFRAIVANRSSQRVFLGGWINRAHRLLTLIHKS